MFALLLHSELPMHVSTPASARAIRQNKPRAVATFSSSCAPCYPSPNYKTNPKDSSIQTTWSCHLKPASLSPMEGTHWQYHRSRASVNPKDGRRQNEPKQGVSRLGLPLAVTDSPFPPELLHPRHSSALISRPCKTNPKHSEKFFAKRPVHSILVTRKLRIFNQLPNAETGDCCFRALS